MKCSVIFLFTASLHSVIIYGQQVKTYLNPLHASWEIFSGVSLVSIHDNGPYEKYGVAKLGYCAGIGLIKELNQRVQVHTRVLYERKGYKLSHIAQYDSGTGKIVNEVNQDYLIFSFVQQYLIGKNKNFSIGTGGYFGLLQKSIGIDKYYYYQQFNKGPNTHAYFKTDAGLVFMLGYSFSVFKKLSLNVQLVESYGLKKMSRFQSPFPNEKTNSIVFLIGISKSKKSSSK